MVGTCAYRKRRSARSAPSTRCARRRGSRRVPSPRHVRSRSAGRLALVPKIYTKTGDDGTTGLLFGGRVGKDDLATDAYGTSDEAVAALGLARSRIGDPRLADTVLRLQRELFVVGAELATAPENRSKLKPGETSVSADMVAALEEFIDGYTETFDMPQEFVIPGETETSAALD